ncbi:MAG TPA: AsmA family protein, partial [Terriglobales bacterium]|nr:AsmA family protein [Terriglobales bacterium]
MSAHPIPPLRDREPPELIPFPRRRRALWKRVLLWGGGAILVLLLLAVVTVFTLLHNARFHQYALRTAQQKLTAALGSEVRAREYTLTWSGISPTLDLYDVSIAGAEPYPDPPLLTADHLHASVRVTSLLQRTWYVDDIAIEHPVVHAFFDRNGVSNLPHSKEKQQSDTDLFTLGVRHAKLTNGEVYYNNRKTPLEADLHDLSLQAGFDPAQTKYSGSLSYHDGHVVMSTFRPIPHELDATFTYTRDTFTLESARLRSGNSYFALHATVSDLANMRVDAHYDAVVDAGEFRRILRNPALPSGVLRASGTAQYHTDTSKPALDTVTLNGRLASNALAMQTPQFHGTIRDLAAQYSVANGNADVRGLHAALLGGTLDGALAMRNLAGNTHSTLHAALHNISLA